ncbi:MAG: chemotaxis protein CheB [Deltaproteobacteria bacterium]|nr:MAG: chemotaxis protein CheB [Deltaproteobacteria bacterium]
MERRDLICIGTSAGGVEALKKIASALPENLPAAVVVVLHLAPDHRSALPHILTGAGPLPALHPKDQEPLSPGRIYIAPPDHHMLVEPGRLRLVRGAKENSHRPAVDPLFRTAAYNYGSRAIGAILTGALDDGTGGLLAIKQRGGTTVVQDPEDAFCPDMPRSALDYVKPDHIAKLSEIGPLLGRLAGGRVEGSHEVSPLLKDEAEIETLSPLHGHETVGMPSPFSCPACGGVLNEVHEAGTVRFRCRTGHGFTPETALVEQRVTIEGALWAALRALEEQAELAHRMATRARRQGSVHSAVRFEDRFEAARKQADVLRRLLAVEAGPQVA